MNEERGAYVSLDPGPELTDAELLTGLVAGGAAARDAWSTLVARYSHKLYAIARSFGFDEATAEDLVQTAWLRLLERPGQLREPAALAGWLATVVRNEARNRITRRREIPTLLHLEVHADETDDVALVEARMVREERVRALRLAFAYLGTECRQLLRLLMAEPALSYAEIAAALGRPHGALGPTRRRCLDQLRARLPDGFEA
jgi:RNA polymerase sigma factor (sigma-70 family)